MNKGVNKFVENDVNRFSPLVGLVAQIRDVNVEDDYIHRFNTARRIERAE